MEVPVHGGTSEQSLWETSYQQSQQQVMKDYTFFKHWNDKPCDIHTNLAHTPPLSALEKAFQ